MIEITAIGGYNEVGRNMTLITYNNESIILDMGLHLDNYIKFTEDEDIKKISTGKLIQAGALPDTKIIDRKKVKAILTTHGHLDHIGGIPYLSSRFKDTPIFATDYTIEVIKKILEDKNSNIENNLNKVKFNKKTKLSKHISATFIPITHSIPHASFIVIHTPEGNIVYACDFKLDNYPVIGDAPNYELIKKIKAKALIIESLYVKEETKSPPEESVRIMIKDIANDLRNNNNLIIFTTFSSQIARLKTITEEMRKIGREVIFIGRSLEKYIAASRISKIFSPKERVLRYRNEIKKAIKEINNNPKKYCIICTGHQGEPKSVLSRFADMEYNLNLKNSTVVFSCKVIPTETTIKNRKILEKKLSKLGAEIIKDIHASGHASRLELKEFIDMINPEIIIPAHSEHSKYFKKIFSDRNVVILNNGNSVIVD
jgi:ribonuclease J